jgi:hypothetical protein
MKELTLISHPLLLWCVYEYTVSSFVNIIYHCRAFSSAERPCYSLRVSCKSDKKRDVHKSQCPLHGSIPKPDKRIADHGASTPNVSQENGFYSWKLLPELQPDLMYNISLPCIFKRWETMLFPQSLMQEWQETGCNVLFMTRHTLSVHHRERWFLGSLLAPIASVVAPLLSTLFKWRN